MKIYSYDAVTKLIEKYINLGGEIHQINDGCLAQGLTVCTADGYKSAVIDEIALNCWSSGQKVRFYNVLPKKYQKMIETL